MSIWNYKSLSRFSEIFYKGLITKNNLVEEIYYNKQDWWLAIKNKVKYFLPSEIIDDLPIKLTSPPEKLHWKEKVVYKPIKYASTKVKAEKKFSFKDLVDNFCDFKHENEKHFLLAKLLFFTAFLDRVNYRKCAVSDFGKDSIQRIAGDLTNECCCFSPNSMAAVEYRLFNKVLGLNELNLISSQEYTFIKKFLLTAGDFKNTYEKSTRGSTTHGTFDTYNIQDLSLILTYNPLFYYVNKNIQDKFFDKVFDYAVLDRLPAFLFKGKLDMTQFDKDDEFDFNYYVKILRTIYYFKQNNQQYLHNYNIDIDSFNLKGRHRIIFPKFIKYIDMYADSEREFKLICDELYQCYKNYLSMLQYKKNTSSHQFINQQKLTVEEVK